MCSIIGCFHFSMYTVTHVVILINCLRERSDRIKFDTTSENICCLKSLFLIGAQHYTSDLTSSVSLLFKCLSVCLPVCRLLLTVLLRSCIWRCSIPKSLYIHYLTITYLLLCEFLATSLLTNLMTFVIATWCTFTTIILSLAANTFAAAFALFLVL